MLFSYAFPGKLGEMDAKSWLNEVQEVLSNGKNKS